MGPCLRRDFSTFLDLLRLSAAVVVFLGHLALPRFGGEALGALNPLGHSAVTVFFVLSGYVIAWAARREGNAVDYLTNRAARIYSVAVPALALTFAIDVLTGNIGYQHVQPWKYVPLFLTFTTDFWFLAENAYSNVPWWSLCYEVWFYVVFGIVLFGRGWWRVILAAAALAAMGPRLWLLFPVWLLGVYLHRLPPLPRPRLLLGIALIAIVMLKISGIEDVLNNQVNDALGGKATVYLRYSRYFLGDYIFAALVALAIAAARHAELGALDRWRTAIVAGASVSFSLYLTHFPLLLAWDYILPGDNPLAIGAATLLCVAVFGIVFERNKRIVRRWIVTLLEQFRIVPPAAV